MEEAKQGVKQVEEKNRKLLVLEFLVGCKRDGARPFNSSSR